MNSLGGLALSNSGMDKDAEEMRLAAASCFHKGLHRLPVFFCIDLGSSGPVCGAILLLLVFVLTFLSAAMQ